MAKHWYVIHTQTGYEDRVKTVLESKVKAGLTKEGISQILVPIEQVSEIKAGKKRISQRKFFPGYIWWIGYYNVESTFNIAKKIAANELYAGGDTMSAGIQPRYIQRISRNVGSGYFTVNCVFCQPFDFAQG